MQRSPGSVESPESRWAGAEGASSALSGLDGRWKVERLSGLVPMPGVYKEIQDGRGRTTAGWSPFRDLPFRLERVEEGVLLTYDSPFTFLRDELRREPDGSWLGRATVAGSRYAWFRMVPAGDGR